MTRKKLLKKLQSLLEKSDAANQQDIEKLHKVIKALKRKQKALELRVAHAEDHDEQQKILKDIEVLKLQRKKGAAVYRQLKGKDEAG